MVLYEKDDIVISTLDKESIPDILKYFGENDFNCDYESGSLRPSNEKFREIMEEILVTENKIEEVLALKKEGKCIGYLACHVEYSRLNIGHIAVDRKERSKGYGRLLTLVALEIANNEGRDVALQCYYNGKKYWPELGFETRDGVHYLYRCKNIKNNLPKIFMSCEEYEEMMSIEQEKQLQSYRSFLNLDIMKRILEI